MFWTSIAEWLIWKLGFISNVQNQYGEKEEKMWRHCMIRRSLGSRRSDFRQIRYFSMKFDPISNWYASYFGWNECTLKGSHFQFSECKPKFRSVLDIVYLQLLIFVPYKFLWQFNGFHELFVRCDLPFVKCERLMCIFGHLSDELWCHNWCFVK